MTKRLTREQRRSFRVRNKLRLVNFERNPNREVRHRLVVTRSNKNIYVQLIDVLNHKTLAAASTLDKELKADLSKGSDAAAAEKVGELVAKRAVAAGHKLVQFDRGGYPYHGRVKALADGARKGGLVF